MAFNRYKTNQLADLIAFLNNYHNIESVAYLHKNPGLLKDKKKKLKKFACTIDGFRALVDNIEKQCGWNPSFTLQDLLCFYEVQSNSILVIDYFSDDVLEQRVSFFQE